MVNPRWPTPDPRFGESSCPDTPVGDRWQNRAKALAYPFLLPLQAAFERVKRGVPELRPPFSWGTRGTEFDYLVSLLGESRIRGRRVLLQGVGDSRESRFWRPYGPARLVGADLFSEPGQSPERSGLLALVAADLSTLPLATSSLDGAASINTLEHVRDVDATLAEAHRVVRPGGWFLATFGPLYSALGGDHIGRLRGGLEHGYNHLLLDPDEYADFVDHMTIEGVDVVQGMATGGRRYVDLDLFSRVSWRQYWEVFDRRLDLEIFRVHVDPEAIEFRRRYPRRWAAILERGYIEEDLLASSISVLGTFKPLKDT